MFSAAADLEGQCEVVTSEISYRSMYQKFFEETFMFVDRKVSSLSDFYYVEPGFYPSITDDVEAIIILIQERHNDPDGCIRIEVSCRTQKVQIYLAKQKSGLAFFSADLKTPSEANLATKVSDVDRKST